MESEQTHISAKLGGNGKNIVVAYILWWFLGFLGIHRFYLDRPTSGLIQILLLALGWIPFFLGWVVLAIWWLLDAYFVYQYVEAYNVARGGSPVGLTLTTSKASSVTEVDYLDYLEKLHSLREKGVLTEEEYQKQRTKALSS